MTEALAGCPHAVRDHARVNMRTHNDVWIDGLRLSGNKPDVEAALQRVNSCAAVINATFKEAPTIAARYTFIGVDFDHKTPSARVADKTRNKLPAAAPTTARISELEVLVSRLIFAAGVVRKPLAGYYMTIKWVNRKVNSLNRTGNDEAVEIPRSIRPQLTQWLHDARSTLTLARDAQTIFRRPDVLYTDASSYGRGAVLFSANYEVAISGAAWPDDTDTTSGNMAALEAQAVTSAIFEFADRLLIHKNVELRIDNTSVTAAVRRGVARSANVNERIAPALRWLADNDIAYTVSYVASDDNPADAPSRGKSTTSAEVAMHIPNASRGEAGRVARCDFVVV